MTLRHDLQSSLGTITMALDVLYTLPIADEQRQWLEIIKRNAEEAMKMVGDLKPRDVETRKT